MSLFGSDIVNQFEKDDSSEYVDGVFSVIVNQTEKNGFKTAKVLCNEGIQSDVTETLESESYSVVDAEDREGGVVLVHAEKEVA